MTTLTLEIADKFAGLALNHVSRPYPYKMDHVLTGPQDAVEPRVVHPIFFGSFDWHSCVHGYWLMARLVRRYPEMPAAEQIKALFAERFTIDNLVGELAYLGRPSARGFERPYGWGWLLALHSELEQHQGGVMTAAALRMRPLAEAFAQRLRDFLPIADYPVRTGVHSSTAFAMRMAADWAEEFDPKLFGLMRRKALSWYGEDRDCQAWEPSQDDFHSPALSEAECMRRLLPEAEFRAWFAQFLPGAVFGEPASLFSPARVSDRTDGKIAHLDGLNFSRAWCWRSIARVVADEGVTVQAHAAADRHIAASLPHVAGDYMGEHWLATFALLALEG